MGALIGFLGSLFGTTIGSIGKLISIETIKFLAWRTFILFLLFVALPIVLYNVFTGLLFDFMDFGQSYLNDQNLSSFTMELTGMGGYIANAIQLPQAFSVYMSFVGIRFLMRFIPFFK